MEEENKNIEVEEPTEVLGNTGVIEPVVEEQADPVVETPTAEPVVAPAPVEETPAVEVAPAPEVPVAEAPAEPVQETPIEHPVEQPTAEPAPTAPTPKEPKKEEKKGSNKLLIIVALLVLVLGGGYAVWAYVLGGNKPAEQPKEKEEQKEEKKEEVKKKSLSEEEVYDIVSKYENYIEVNGKNTVNPFTTFIDEQGTVLDLTEKEVAFKVLNVAYHNFYNYEETIQLDDLKENIKKMFKIEDSVELPNSFCINGNKEIAYKLIDNAYVKHADTCGGGAYSAIKNTINENYIENTIDGNKLTIIYKVLFIGFDSDFNMKIYSDGARTKEVATLKNISSDPMIIEHEEFKEKFYEKGLTLKIIFEKENDDYILEKVEKGE